MTNTPVSSLESKATSQEIQEQRKFAENARKYRDFFIQNGRIQGRYLPTLLLAVVMATAFLHSLILLSHSQLSIGGLVAYMGLMRLLSFPTFISIWSFDLVQLGVAGSERILTILREETELDENETGYAGEMKGEIVFENVTFSYGTTPILKNISFRAEPGQTIAIVGQTGAGKSSLTKLVNRIYDVNEGRVLVDGIDVREWILSIGKSGL